MSATQTNDVELIVLDWDGGDALTNCLHSIDVQTLKPARVIILDNGSRTSVHQRLPSQLLRIPHEIIRSETNLGFTGGINRAMQQVRTPFVGWINNDAVLAENWLEKVLAAVSGEGKVAGAQSVVMRDKVFVDGAGISIDDGTFRQIGHGQRFAKLGQVTQPWGISATAALFRTHALKEVSKGSNVLRPDLFAYYEDVDLCARLRAKGWKFKLVPEPLVMHRGSASASRLGTAGFKMRIRNRYIVARANRGVGKVSALINEDITEALKSMFSGQVRMAIDRMGGVMEGLRKK
jgi:GT2 family glycosyltransferase